MSIFQRIGFITIFISLWISCVGSPLHEAAAVGAVSRVRALLQEGADPNARDRNGRTPLHRAVADPFKYELSNTAKDVLEKVQERKRIAQEMITQLLDYGASVEAQDEGGNRPLHVVVSSFESSAEESVTQLLRAGAHVNTRNYQGQTPLHRVRNAGVIRPLLHAGAEINAQDNDRRTPLAEAACQGGYAVVTTLLKENAVIRTPDARRVQSLAWPASWAQRITVALLGDRDKAPEQQYRMTMREQEAAFQYALQVAKECAARKEIHHVGVHAGASVAVALIIYAGARPTPKARSLSLHTSTREDDTPLALFLLAAGADATALDARGDTALHRAARRGAPIVAALLLQAGASANQRNTAGYTPLYEALHTADNYFTKACPLTMRVLLQAGATLDPKRWCDANLTLTAARVASGWKIRAGNGVYAGLDARYTKRLCDETATELMQFLFDRGVCLPNRRAFSALSTAAQQLIEKHLYRVYEWAGLVEYYCAQKFNGVSQERVAALAERICVFATNLAPQLPQEIADRLDAQEWAIENAPVAGMTGTIRRRRPHRRYEIRGSYAVQQAD